MNPEFKENSSLFLVALALLAVVFPVFVLRSGRVGGDHFSAETNGGESLNQSGLETKGPTMDNNGQLCVRCGGLAPADCGLICGRRGFSYFWCTPCDCLCHPG